MMTAGQNKGAMLLTLLHDTNSDSRRRSSTETTTFATWRPCSRPCSNRGKKITAFHYTRETANVQSFNTAARNKSIASGASYRTCSKKCCSNA